MHFRWLGRARRRAGRRGARSDLECKLYGGANVLVAAGNVFISTDCVGFRWLSANVGGAVFRVHFAFKRSDKSNQSSVSLARLNHSRTASRPSRSLSVFHYVLSVCVSLNVFSSTFTRTMVHSSYTFSLHPRPVPSFRVHFRPCKPGRRISSVPGRLPQPRILTGDDL